MKFEMIFGDEALFDGAPDECFCVAKNVYDENVYYKAVDACLFWLDGGKWKPLKFMSYTPNAMRRIIKEPKRWTVEDQKAGRLPEVGCRVDFCHKLNTNWRTGEIKYIDNHVAVIKADDIDRPFVYEFDRVEFKPIETPAEKAQRERDEWIDNACSFICFYDIGRVDAIKSLEITYDKLKSGELPMPKKDGE